MKKKVLQAVALISILALPALGWAAATAATGDCDCPCGPSCLLSWFN